MKDIPAYIYALYQNGVVVYVGQALAPDVRKRGHILTDGESRINGLPMMFKVIATTDLAGADRMERDFIEAYKALGECAWNQQLPKCVKPRKRRLVYDRLSKTYWPTTRAFREGTRTSISQLRELMECGGVSYKTVRASWHVTRQA